MESLLRFYLFFKYAVAFKAVISGDSLSDTMALRTVFQSFQMCMALMKVSRRQLRFSG